MKKVGSLALSLVLVFSLLIFSGCFRDGVSTTKTIYLNYLPTNTDEQYEGSFTEYIGTKKAASVVSVYSYFQYRNKQGSYSEDAVLGSGIILNDDGYVLTSSRVVKTYFSDQSSSDSLTVSKLWINLNSLYGKISDDSLSAKLIDCNEELGLAIIKLNNEFYYYTDASKTETKKGFQIKGEFFDGTTTVKTGNDCAFVGDILGEGVSITVGVISNNEMTTLGEIDFNDNTYNYIQASAALNEQMLGGALYDVNGYIIGVTQTKIVSDTDNSVFNKIGLALPSACAIDYINFVADNLQTVIEYTQAVKEG